MSEKLQQLVEMTRTLGEEHRRYVIIGEGNTSCRIDENSFYVKASGQQMNGIGADGFVAVRFDPILEMLEQPELKLSEQKEIMQTAKVDPNVPAVPSVEVSFHAMLLHECEVPFVGHTHSLTVNQILCSDKAEDFAKKRMFPDDVVLTGPESVLLEYYDPGLPLAIVMRDAVREFMDRIGEAPKVILLKNHGIIVLGQTPTEILNTMAMAAKSAEIFVGAHTVGNPVYMTEEDVWHIYKRPDEIYRRKRFVTGE